MGKARNAPAISAMLADWRYHPAMLATPQPCVDALSLRIMPASPFALPDDDAWAALAEHAAEANPFLENWFLRPALEHLRGSAPVWLAIGEAHGRLVGLMPLTLAARYGRMPVQHVTNWMHYQSFIGTPLIAQGWESIWFSALLQALDHTDWTKGFLSLAQLDPVGPVFAGLRKAAAMQNRPAPVVHRRSRALLASGLDAEAYLEANIRSKKRKEWRRLGYRLAELGKVETHTLGSGEQLEGWCDAFLDLEAAGWKGFDGAALANTAETRRFFYAMMHGAWSAKRLDMLSMTLNGKPIAMLVNFRTPPGSWSFKIAHDPELARFSPGVMIELDNLARVLGDPGLAWMDSCAVEDHPMINSLWAERRTLVQVSVPLSGLRRRSLFALCRAAEQASARFKSRPNPEPLA